MSRLLVALAASFTLAAPGSRADAPNALDQAPSSYAKLDGHRVHYKSIGTGPEALVFVHGWTCDLNTWRYQVPAFAGKTRVIAIDLPGHGQSDKPETDYTMDLFAKAIDAVLADAGVERAVLVGHSMGTPVVRQFSRLYPKKTRALVAVDGALRSFFPTKEQTDQFVARFSGENFKPNYERFINGMISERTPAAVKKQLKETLPAAPPHVAASAMRGMFDARVWKDDPITVPLLVVVARSPNWSADYEAYVRKLAPGVDYRVMPGVGHFLMMEKPEEFNAILAEFLGKAKG